MRLWLAALLWLVAAPALAAGRFVEQVVPSGQIAPPRVTIWLPDGYDRGRARYPVVYMHDGQNVFFPERSGFNKVWAADKSAERLIAARKVAPFIIVAVDHPGEARWRQYFPTRVVPKDFRREVESFSKASLTGDAYLRFLADELKPLIDRSYRTKRDPRHTAIVGSSMGGLASCYALIERPDVFGRAGCVSTHWPLIDPGQHQAAVIGYWQSYLKAQLGKPDGRRVWMDHGTATLDAHYAPYQQAVTAAFKRAGWRQGRDFEARVFEGAAHEENAWAARLDDILAYLLR